MTWTVMAVVAALLIGHAVPKLRRWRDFSWSELWLGFVCQQETVKSGQRGYAGLPLGCALPALALGLSVFLLSRISGLFPFLLALAALLYTWGPRDLDLDVNAVLDATGQEAREQAAKALYEEGQAVSLDGPAAVAAGFENALTRWFAVLFWFLLLGPGGALAYRLLYLLVHHKHDMALPEPLRETAGKALNLAHCPPAHLMTLAMALAANCGLRADYGFLAAAANASVASELADEEADAVDGPSSGPALLELRDALSLAWRMLLLWLALLAIFVPAGFLDPELRAVGMKHAVAKCSAFAQEAFADARFAKPQRIVDDAVTLIGQSSVVSLFEKPKFRDFLRGLDND